jgi:hypothetical protein
MVSDIKLREVTSKERAEKIREAEQEIIKEKLGLEAKQKAAKAKIDAEHKALVEKEAKAKTAENKKEAEKLRKEREIKADEAETKQERFVEKKLALDIKLKEIKERAEEEKKKDEYAPIRREVETLLFKLSVEPGFAEEGKALSRKKITPEDRERVRAAILKRGSWYNETFSDLFLPPQSVAKQIVEFKSKEESKRRAEESKGKPKEKKRK